MSRIAGLLAIGLAVMLSGCFMSQKELITANAASYPFKRIVFQEVESEERSELTRTAEGYRSDDQEDAGVYRFREIAKDTYVVQVSVPEEAKPVYLFALIKIDRTARVAHAYATVAEEGLKVPGMTKCEDALCFDRLETYTAYAMKLLSSGAEPEAEYQILELE